MTELRLVGGTDLGDEPTPAFKLRLEIQRQIRAAPPATQDALRALERRVIWPDDGDDCA